MALPITWTTTRIPTMTQLYWRPPGSLPGLACRGADAGSVIVSILVQRCRPTQGCHEPAVRAQHPLSIAYGWRARGRIDLESWSVRSCLYDVWLVTGHAHVARLPLDCYALLGCWVFCSDVG